MSRRTILFVSAAALVALLGAGAGYVLSKRSAAQDVVGSPTEEFVTTDAPVAPPSPPAASRPGIAWPRWGYSISRVRISPYAHRPPFRTLWGFRGRTLIEYPPAVGLGNVYVANNEGVLFAVSARTGRLVWRFRTERVQATSPALSGRTVFHTFMYRRSVGKSDPTGEIVALDALTGKVRWRRTIAPSESSPLVRGNTVYVGDWSGRVYALDKGTGSVRWTYDTGGEVKGAVTASGRRLYVGSYDSHLYSLDARTGKLLWRASAQERIGTRGRFYSTPTVAYGRVYVGATDGKVYSFGATSGELRWSRSTGAYVYGSPAIWRQRVYVGSYDRTFYALDAATGEVVWRFAANGPISGSATIVDGLVYFPTLRGLTYALDAATGKEAWRFGDGGYAGVVADQARLYLVGFGRVYALAPRRAG